jgi:ATP-dependent Lon protease
MSNTERKCSYIFKKGPKKGFKCNKVNCTLHFENSNQQIPQGITVSVTLPTKKDKSNEIKENDKKKMCNIKDQILKLNTSNDNKNIIMNHYNNVKKLDNSTTEYYKNQMYIDTAISIPWNIYYNINETIKVPTKDFIKNLKSEFDKEIYGMDNIKNEIINYICKFITNPSSEKNNLALYGNAGVCKTKFIKVLSKILKIPLKIISLGGIKDSSYLLGNGYVYVESNCGNIIQSIIDTKVMNPIMYFDELDKISESNGGQDIYSVISNLTDSTINCNFSDNYFRGMNFDLSKVFYIFTFNDISKINKVLLDRLNVIYVENPKTSEKIIILEKYCVKDIINNIGIKTNITFDKDCYYSIIQYTDKHIDKHTSSGIRESIRILEKIILEINKEILLEILPKDNINININLFNKYFTRLEKQFIFQESNNNTEHMYI